ncbi:MAG: ribbon-helix-helix domain-containing protein [Candidatus Omnitrophica bacterium]|nr:ribbon-helix-helix domain-containing protein [Candidatus Omnitrophota bacterium]
MTVQLSTRIDPKVKKILSELHKKTHVPIRVLTEKAICLLKERYESMSQMYQQGAANERFMELIDYSLRSHDVTYRKLAE